MQRNAMLSKTGAGVGRAAGFSGAAATGRARSVHSGTRAGLKGSSDRRKRPSNGTSGAGSSAGPYNPFPGAVFERGWIVRLRILLLALALAPSAFVSAGPRTLEVSDLRATPPIAGRLVKGVTWVPHTSRLAFIAQEGEGDSATESLVLEDAATGKRERLLGGAGLELPGNAGKATLDGYEWSPDGLLVLLAAEPGLAIYDTRKKSLETLTREEAEYPSFSPTGRAVAFVRHGNLFVVDVQSRKETQLTRDGGAHVFNGRLDWVYEEELSNHGGRAYEWSPDGSFIAYLRLDENRVPTYPLVDFLSVPHAGFFEQRYPNPGDANAIPSVHIVDIEGHERSHVDFSTGDDLYVVPDLSWVPDSTSVAYEVMTRQQDHLEVKLLSTGGKTRLLFEERDPYWINVPDRINSRPHEAPLRFLKGDRFLWLSERSGFSHIYTGSLANPALVPVTKGSWQVDGIVGVDEPSGTVYFTSTEKDPRERQIDKIHLDGTGFARVTTDPGVHTGELSPDGTYLAATQSSLQHPPLLQLLSAAGKVVRTVDEPHNRLSEFQWPTVEFAEVKAADGTRLFCELMKPPSFDPKKTYPAVVYVYGGPHAQLVRDEFPRLSNLLVLASHGFLVWTLDNRGSWGRGHAFESVIFKDMGRAELADQLEGLRYLKSLPFVDKERVGLTGWSYGGYMTLYAMTHAPEAFKCAVAGAPVADWKLYDSIYTERYMRTPKENPEGYKTSSPLAAASKVKGRLLLIHGTADDNVHMYNTINFVKELSAAGISYELELGPGEKHGFRSRANQDARDKALVAFFEKNL
jgi:dipeptidyl-peptidase-4